MKKNLNKKRGFTLAEAYLRLSEIDTLLDGLRSAVTRVSSHRVSDMFNRASGLLSESESLRRRIKLTEYSTTLSGTTICDLNLIIDTLEERVKFFCLVSKRADLSSETVNLIAESIIKFRSTKESLQRKHEEVIWEIELLE